MSVPFLEKASGLSAATIAAQIRAAHAHLDKTRCIGWLRATGMRPDIVADHLGSGPVRVQLKAAPRPEEACDLHPVEE